MSFGFSVGDFLAAVNLIADVISALREAGGSASQYQHVTNKLGFLDRALRDVNRLEPAEGLEQTLETIKTTALSCQIPLLEYLENIKKYDGSLGAGESSGVMKDVFHKMKWQASKKLEAAMRLEAEIVAYLAAINLLVGFYKIKVDFLTEQRAKRRFESLTTTLANLQVQTQTTSENVVQVRNQVEEGTRVVREDITKSTKETSQALSNLKQSCFANISEYLKTAGGISEATFQTYSKVSEIYDTILWVRTRITQPDTRHTWLQDPMQLEDAYGRVVPIPVEFDYAMMEGALRGHFRKGRGSSLVKHGQWQLFNPSKAQTVLSAENWEPIPGMKITMAMIIPQFDDEIVCPRLNCSSKICTDALGGGKICFECGAWFDSFPKSSTQKMAEIVDISDEELEQAVSADEPFEKMEGELLEINEEDLQCLRNARVRLEDPRAFWAAADKASDFKG